MSSNKTIYKVICFVLWVGGTPALAQDEQGMIEAEAPAPEISKKAGYVRVWHFASNLKSPIDVELSGRQGEPIVLSRSMPRGRMLSYYELKPGKYQLKASLSQPASSETQSSETQETSQSAEQSLVDPLELAIQDGGYQTVILRNQGDKVRSVVVDDSFNPASPGAKRLRVFHFARGEKPTLKLGQNQILFQKMDEGFKQVSLQNPGLSTFWLVFQLPNGNVSEQTVEVDYQALNSVSVIIMFDRYDRLTFQAVQDATLQ